MNYPVQTEQSLASTLPLSDRESAGLHRKSHLPARAWATPHFWQRECARRNEASATVACNADSLRVWIFPLREKGRLCGPAPLSHRGAVGSCACPFALVETVACDPPPPTVQETELAHCSMSSEPPPPVLPNPIFCDTGVLKQSHLPLLAYGHAVGFLSDKTVCCQETKQQTHS